MQGTSRGRVKHLIYLALTGALLTFVASPAHGAGAPRIDSHLLVNVASANLLQVSPNGALEAIVDASGKLCVYSTTAWTLVRCAEALTRTIDTANVAWSPDSTRIAFTENWAEYAIESDVWLFSVATGKLVDLTDDHAFGNLLVPRPDGVTALTDGVPAWSPSGDAIYFTRTVGKQQSTEIYRVPAAGGAAKLIANAVPDQRYAISFGMLVPRSGQNVVYTLGYYDPNDLASGLYVVRILDGHVNRAIKPDAKFGTPYLLGVTPDGALALVYYPFGLGLSGPSQLGVSYFALANLRSSVVTPIVPQGVDSRGFHSPSAAVLSPDGSKLLYVYRTSKDLTRIVLRNLHTNTEQLLSYDGEKPPVNNFLWPGARRPDSIISRYCCPAASNSLVSWRGYCAPGTRWAGRPTIWSARRCI